MKARFSVSKQLHILLAHIDSIRTRTTTNTSISQSTLFSPSSSISQYVCHVSIALLYLSIDPSHFRPTS